MESKKKFNSDNQEDVFNFEPINFKEADVQTYTLKINSKDRNLIREPNPFNFEIIFNQEQQINNPRAVIPNKFENIKRISLSQICIPRFIPRDYIGEPVTGVTPVFNSVNSVSLSYYPGININNTVIPIIDMNGNESNIEVLELVDLGNRKLYIIAIQYNNPFYINKYINIKAEFFSYLNINNVIYPISDITGNIITLTVNSNLNPLPINTNDRLILGDYYKNCLMVDTNGTKIGFNTTSIVISSANILNFQYLYPGQYLEYQIIKNPPTGHPQSHVIYERDLFKISSINKVLTNSNSPDTIANTSIIILGTWVNNVPDGYNLTDIFYDHTSIIRLNQLNYGARDLFDERVFYLSLNPFVPSKNVSTDPTMDSYFGILYPFTPNSSKDYLYLRGDAIESYTNINLQKTSNKVQFSLMDSNNQLIGTIYNKYFNLYQPNNNVAITSYLPYTPDVNIILKIEEVERKF
jgi:hypothetical protein